MAGKKKKKNRSPFPIYMFGLIWVIFACLAPLQEPFWLALAVISSSLFSFLCGRMTAKKSAREETPHSQESKQAEHTAKTSANPAPSPEAGAILEEANRALREMGRLYAAINEPEVRSKINDIMHITDKMAQDALEDPSDIPQIKKFFNYYLPTTIKLLNAYDRMRAQEIRGENLDKSMGSITQMLDAAVDAYRKRLDELFANQALDIETDIEVLNTMLAREGLAGTKEFTGMQ